MTVQVEIGTCTAKSHGASQNAWRHGCRHPEAIAAHRKWTADNKPFSLRPAAVGADGECLAPKHGSWQAYVYGCRHPEAVRAWDRRLEGKRAKDRMRRARTAEALEQARLYAGDRRRAEKLTGGRLNSDPRRPWRGGKMAVGKMALFWITRGMFIEEATMAELMVAAIRLESVRVVDGPYLSRPLTNLELGARLGADDRQIYRLRYLRARLRSERTQRRLADSKWRAAVVAAAIERGR